jgi:hypothetical protein
MKDETMRAGARSRILGWVLVALGLSACGGEPSTPSPEEPETRSLVVKIGTLDFSNGEGELKTPPAQRIQGQILNFSGKVHIGVAYTRNGLENVTYDISTNPFTVEITPKAPSEVGFKTVTDQILIAACADRDCDRHLPGSPAQVEVRYTVTTALRTPGTMLPFVQVLGSSESRSFPVSVESVGPLDWTARADPSWLRLDRAMGQTPSSLEVGLDTDQAFQLPVGRHQGKVTLSNPQGSVPDRVIEVTLYLNAPVLSGAPTELRFGDADGKSLSPQTVTLTLDTGNNAYDWTAAIDTGSGPQWLSLNSTTGTVSSAGTPLTVSMNPAGVRSGTHHGRLIFTTSVRGVKLTHTIPVSLSLSGHKLWVSDNGVDMVSTPSASKLTQTVTVRDSTGQSPMPWTATSNQPWLSVTPGGDDTLSLSANPAGLANDTVHMATVTLLPNLSWVGEAETIQVGLWVSASVPNPRDTLGVSCSESGLVMDPIRPYAYLHKDATLSVYNVYTGGLVAQLPGLGLSLGQMIISTDGSTLYVVDQGKRIIPVNLSTLSAGRSWSIFSSFYRITYARPNGHGVIITNKGVAYDATQGTSLLGNYDPLRWTSDLFELTASVDGSMLCGGGGDDLSCYDLRYKNGNPGMVEIIFRSRKWEANILDVALTQDGSRLYSAHWLKYGISAYDTPGMTALSQRGDATHYADSVAVGPDGRLYGVLHTKTGPKEVWVFDEAGTRLGTYLVAPADKYVSQLVVSGDGKRLGVCTNEPKLEFISVP